MRRWGSNVAERAGFEPATRLSARTRFPVALLRPLGHLSAPPQRSVSREGVRARARIDPHATDRGARPRGGAAELAHGGGGPTAGAIRLGLLSLFVVLTAMVRGHLTHRSAGWLLLAGALFVVTAAGLFALATRRVALALPFPERGLRLTDAVLLVLRRIGLPLVGLAFFLVWTFVYIGIWWVHPHDAFRGLEPHPRFADFFYTAVSTAFISPPGDIVAHSR